MATDPTIPFQYLPVGGVDPGKTGANFDSLLKYIRDRNDGTVSWDVLSVSGASTLTSPVTINGSGSMTELRINNTATDGDPAIFWQLSGTNIFYAGIDDSDSDKFQIGRGSAVGTNTDVIVSQSSGAVMIRGTATNDDASAGYVGEEIRSSITTATNFPTSGNYGDLTSISLTAGDWDVTAQILAIQNGSTTTAVEVGISSTSGNSGTGLVAADNQLDFTPPNATTNPTVATIANYRVPVSGTTTYYLKYRATYSAGNPQARGRLSARRRR